MEVITKFKAKDKKEFNSRLECREYEILIDRVDLIMSQMDEKPNNDECNFSNGKGYLQHDPIIFKTIRKKILEICKEYIDHQWVQQSIDDETVHSSWVGRLISDYNIAPLSIAWYRFSCIDSSFREWGQPYYANNPEKGENICLNN